MFPSTDQRQEFLEQVRLWSKVEGLPRIDTLPLRDGVGVRFFSAGPWQRRILRLIDAFGAFVPLRTRRAVPQDPGARDEGRSRAVRSPERCIPRRHGPRDRGDLLDRSVACSVPVASDASGDRRRPPKCRTIPAPGTQSERLGEIVLTGERRTQI